jgi:hypothetical protein
VTGGVVRTTDLSNVRKISALIFAFGNRGMESR